MEPASVKDYGDDTTSRPFTCCECGTFNDMTEGCPTRGACQRDHCRECGVSLHVQFGDAEHKPCGGVMRVKWAGEQAFDGAVSGTIELAQWRCDGCGWRIMMPLDEEHPYARAVANAMFGGAK